MIQNIQIVDNGNSSINFTENGQTSSIQKGLVVSVNVVNTGVIILMASGKAFIIEDFANVTSPVFANADDLRSAIKGFINTGGGCPAITLTSNFNANQFVMTVNAGSGFQASGGTAPYTYSIGAGGIPGLTLNPLTGEYAGITTLVSANYTFTITATDANACIGSQQYTISVNEVNNMIGRGANITGTLLTAYNQLFIDLNTASLRANIGRLNLFGADTFGGIFVPAINSLDGVTTIGGATDVNNNFVSGDWTVNGLKGNGTTKFIGTGLTPSLEASLSFKLGIGFTIFDASGTDTFDMGNFYSSSYVYMCARFSDTLRVTYDNIATTPTVLTALGFSAFTQIDGTQRITQRDGTQFVDTTTFGTTKSGGEILVLSGGPNLGFTPKGFGGYFIFESMTAAKMELFRQAINTFYTNIGR